MWRNTATSYDDDNGDDDDDDDDDDGDDGNDKEKVNTKCAPNAWKSKSTL